MCSYWICHNKTVQKRTFADISEQNKQKPFIIRKRVKLCKISDTLTTARGLNQLCYVECIAKYITIKQLDMTWTQKPASLPRQSSYSKTHTRSVALFPGLPGWAGTRIIKPIWILLKQETVASAGPYAHMQVCTSLQTDNHASTPPLHFLQAGCPSCRPNNSVKALKATSYSKS